MPVRLIILDNNSQNTTKIRFFVIKSRIFFLVGDCSPIYFLFYYFCAINRRNVNDRLMLDILIRIKNRSSYEFMWKE